MPGSIVCGVDGSKAAATAVRFARTLSDQLGLRLVLVHVTEVPVVSPRAARHFFTELRTIALDAGDELLRWVCQTEGLSEEVVRRVELGKPAERLVAVSDEDEAELLVVGSRGRGPLRSVLLGSVSAGVARTARCPVAIIREQAGESPHGKRRLTSPSQAHVEGCERA